MSSPPSSPLDFSGLTISHNQSQNQYDSGIGLYQQPQYHYATSPAAAPYPGHSSQQQQTPLKGKNARQGLPMGWMDQGHTSPMPSQDPAASRSMSPPGQTMSDFSSSGGSPPPMLQSQYPLTPGAGGGAADDDVIPTAIVIKNIPFNVKRETLLDIIASLNIPTPYAFNYHLDPQGAFRGLAFANFRQASDADAVVAALNGFDVQGRRLRVEYKKVLQAGEKERIEREKAIRRMRSMQIEKEQQAPSAATPPVPSPYDEFGAISTQQQQPSFQRSFSGASGFHYSPPSLPTVPPMPVAQPYQGEQASSPPLGAITNGTSDKGSNELDMNDPSTLDIYSRILLFKDDRMRDELAFSRNLTPRQRRVVHLVAQKLGVYHYSVGEGEDRYAVVTRQDPNPHRPHTLSRAPSAYLSASPHMGAAAAALRSKKSMPDMKTLHTPSPRLTSRASNGNIREGFATIASSSRRSPGGLGGLFGAPGSSAIPPVPSLPSSVMGLSMNNNTGMGGENAAGVVRQPRGPGQNVSGFGSRREQRVAASESSAQPSRGFEARSHEPLEI